ncbi:restriction endonuclease subunit S [bacterium]|nr:restriction endonuclease subunit S [bacterium]
MTLNEAETHAQFATAEPAVSDWPVLSLGSVCRVKWGNGKLTKQSYVEGGEFLAVSATGGDGRIGYAEHLAYTPVLSAIGANCGRIFLPTEDFTAIKNTITLTPVDGLVIGKFLFYLIESVQLPIRGAGQPFISKRDIEEFEISLPPLDEQKRIVAKLDATSALASAYDQSIKVQLRGAKDLRKSFFRETFLNAPNIGECYLSDLGENLDSMRVPITKDQRKIGSVPYYGASGIVDYVQDLLFDEPLLLVSEDGANLLSRSSPIAFPVDGPTWINNHAHVLRFDNPITQAYVELFIENTRIDDYVTGAAQPKLNQKALNSIPIQIPNTIEGQRSVVQSIKKCNGLSDELVRLNKERLKLSRDLVSRSFGNSFESTV